MGNHSLGIALVMRYDGPEAPVLGLLSQQILILLIHSHEPLPYIVCIAMAYSQHGYALISEHVSA